MFESSCPVVIVIDVVALDNCQDILLILLNFRAKQLDLKLFFNFPYGLVMDNNTNGHDNKDDGDGRG